MKKKLAMIVSAVMAFSALSISAFAQADETAQTITGEGQDMTRSGSAVVSTEAAPSYTVLIPADTEIPFNSTSYAFGEVKLESGVLHKNAYVSVTLSNSGNLVNEDDSEAKIPYTVEDAEGVFESAAFNTVGDSKELTIKIAEDAWKVSRAGKYSDTNTFEISYEQVS